MEDKIDEIFAMIGNKKNLIIIGIGYIILMVVIIAIIWWPEKKEYATYEKVNIESKQTQLTQNYVNKISDMLKKSRTDELKQLISNEYVNHVGKSSQEIINDLKSQGFFSSSVEVKGANVYTDGDTYVYSITAYAQGNKRNINIIETYPYNYKIVFDDFYSFDEKSITSTVQNIKFKIKDIYKNLKYVEMNIEIENLNKTYAKFDFNSASGVQAVLKDGTAYSPINLVSNEAYTNIQPNMVLNKNFVFEIPAQLQDGIEYIVFRGVSLEFTKQDIKVNF